MLCLDGERWPVVMRKSLNLLRLRSNVRQHRQMDVTVRQTPPKQQQVEKELQSLCKSAIVVSSVSPSTQWVSVQLARDVTLGVACDFISSTLDGYRTETTLTNPSSIAQLTPDPKLPFRF